MGNRDGSVHPTGPRQLRWQGAILLLPTRSRRLHPVEWLQHGYPRTPWLLLFAEHSWAEVDEYFLPDVSMQEQRAPASPEHHFASGVTCVGGGLLEESSAGRLFRLHQRKRAFTNKTLSLPN